MGRFTRKHRIFYGFSFYIIICSPADDSYSAHTWPSNQSVVPGLSRFHFSVAQVPSDSQQLNPLLGASRHPNVFIHFHTFLWEKDPKMLKSIRSGDMWWRGAWIGDREELLKGLLKLSRSLSYFALTSLGCQLWDALGYEGYELIALQRGMNKWTYNCAILKGWWYCSMGLMVDNPYSMLFARITGFVSPRVPWRVTFPRQAQPKSGSLRSQHVPTLQSWRWVFVKGPHWSPVPTVSFLPPAGQGTDTDWP